ncbi:MAG TPA: hypothetical protein VKU41_09355 [Polyangiaceae bacterium]|nr:hypothetical protein [Polyangiaceae bacterium]
MHFADPLAVALVVVASASLIFGIISLDRAEDAAAAYGLVAGAVALRAATRVVGPGDRV